LKFSLLLLIMLKTIGKQIGGSKIFLKFDFGRKKQLFIDMEEF